MTDFRWIATTPSADPEKTATQILSALSYLEMEARFEGLAQIADHLQSTIGSIRSIDVQ